MERYGTLPDCGSWVWSGLVFTFARIRGGLKVGDFFVRLSLLAEAGSTSLLGGDAPGAEGDGGGGAMLWHGGGGRWAIELTTTLPSPVIR